MENNTTIRLAGIVDESYTDGTGIRLGIFTQGCGHNCKGCHNPETHDFNAGYIETVDNIINKLKENPMLDGITLSGGDPLYQIDSSIEIAKRTKDLGLNVWCYTGFTWEEIQSNPHLNRILQYIDVLVDGEFKIEQRYLELAFRGSKNQRIIDVKASLKEGNVKLMDI